MIKEWFEWVNDHLKLILLACAILTAPITYMWGLHSSVQAGEKADADQEETLKELLEKLKLTEEVVIELKEGAAVDNEKFQQIQALQQRLLETILRNQSN